MTVTELAIAHHEREHTDRWQPTRAGIINVWRYYDETFTFHEGRLLLRGPNGTGKSKALELLLPYLFDANLRPHRLSTFGSGDRTMHWNLMGEGNQGSTRVGYVWLEFQRGEETFTCGARLQATTNTTNVTSAYFTTSRRIGELALVNDAGRPLTRADLVTAIGDAGEVHGSPGDYRRTVRTTLFPGVSEQRYDSLITALLQLRTPKLSERLDPSVLSTLLSRALPPLDQSDIAEIAEGFERLDRQREDLKRLGDEVGTAETLATRQRGYAQRVLRASAAALISATSTMTELTRTARESQQQYEAQTTALAETKDRDRLLGEQSGTTEAQIVGITKLPAYVEGSRLDELRQQLAGAKDQAARASAHAAKLRGQADQDAEVAAKAATEAEHAAEAAARTAADARHAADRAGMPSVHQEVDATEDLHTSRQLLRAAVDSRTGQVGKVRAALVEHEKAVHAREEAEKRLEHSRGKLAEAETAEAAASQAHQEALAAFADAFLSWTRRCQELVVIDPEDLLGHRVAMVEVVNEAATRAREEFSRTETRLNESHRGLAAQLGEHAKAREKLVNEVDVPPPAPHTRVLDRNTAPGAPLWRLVSFRSEVPADVQASVEAALEASGLLDAWVLPESELSLPGSDTFVEALLATPAPGPTVADVLVAENDRVRQILRGIAYGESAPDHVASVGADGTWRLASTFGHWAKSEPAYIGAAARDRARQRLIAELSRLIAETERQIAAVDQALHQVADRRTVLDRELAEQPRYDSVARAEEEHTKAQLRCGTLRDAVVTAVGYRDEAERAVGRALRALSATAAEHSLPTSPEALDLVLDAVAAMRSAGDRWLDDRQQAVSTRQTATSATTRAEAGNEIAEDAEQTAVDRAQDAEELAITVDTVEKSVGVEYRQLDEQLTALRTRKVEITAERDRLRGQESKLERLIGTLEEKRQGDLAKQEVATATRDTASKRFRHLMGGHLPEDAKVTPDVGDSKRSTLDAARRLADTLATTPHEPRLIRDAEARLRDTVHGAQEQLSGRADLTLELDEDVVVLTALADGARLSATGLLAVLREERDRTGDQITSGERELFDKTLTGDTRRHIAERIRGANELVDTMNQRLERVRTASRVRVRLVWQVDPTLPPGTREARDLLLRDPATLAEPEREALHLFFRERVDEARSTETATGWEQQLLQVLDYTTWHQFVVKVDRANGEGWQPVTKRLHGALSGGEKAIVLHLPLFAAAAAHYQATPTAPRLIMLDEVFVGVDSTNRGQLLELLVAFELDLVLTSDHEWCDYRELTGIAIHQLETGRDGDDAVTTVHFTWDGHDIKPDDG
jgi:uncharacterized protein (TIGR02680 family)